MNRLSNFHIALRTLSALALMFAVTISVLPQHEGHVMPKPAAKPKPKAAPKKRRAAPRPRRTPMRRATTPRPSPSPSPHVMTPGMQIPTASPSPAPHVMAPGMQMPTTSPSPSQGHVMTPGMQMPSQPQEIQRPRREVIPAVPILRLEELEAMAMQRNPTLAQAEASIQAAEGRRRQAGMFPNPIAGYFLEEFAFRSPGETMEHGVFVEQTIPLGGKLSKARRVFEREKDQAVILAEAQRLRVINSIRVLYYETLGAQRLVELRDDLSQLAREAVEITKELYNVGQADRPDQIEIEIEAERSEIDFLRAQNDWLRSWRTLAAMVGNPQLEPGRLADSPEADLAPLPEAQLLDTLLSQSPDVRVAQAGVERSRAVLARARAERIPDLFLKGGLGYNYERFEPVAPGVAGRRKGPEGRLEVGINVPIFNRNQGGIAAAEAELAIAERDLERLQLVMRSRFASAFHEYRNAQQMVERYRTQVLPRARQG
ncbi:MAG: TolC family protein, partial [Pyrinomonadaceae bacterium]